MKKLWRAALPAAMLFLTAAALPAAEKKLMHCFYFTPIEGASQADWDAFHKATEALPGKIPGLTRVWHGTLLRPFMQFNTDAETRKKLQGGEQKATGPVTARTRTHGICMEMDNEAALKVYAGHPAHKEWETLYGKVRQPGTMTFDIVGH